LKYLGGIGRKMKGAIEGMTIPFERILNAARSRGRMRGEAYAAKLATEADIFKDQEDINALPEIFHYWSNKYLRPMLEEFGVSNPDQFFAKYLHESARSSGIDAPVFVSIGAGNCDTEIRVAQLMKRDGLKLFTIECLEMNSHMLERGRQMAEQEGMAEHFEFVEGDFNNWKGKRLYAGIMANQSLHHVLNIESLFDAIKRSLHPRAYFVTSDMIGRNGHQRWPEALAEVHRFWQELPAGHRYNVQLNRHEELYENWDCSVEGFEGVRAQEIVPQLLKRFHFHLYIAFANVIDVFIDRAFGHHFKADGEWDRDFIDRVHALDEQALSKGKITPTHMMAVLTTQPCARLYSRGLTPGSSVRNPSRAQ